VLRKVWRYQRDHERPHVEGHAIQ